MWRFLRSLSSYLFSKMLHFAELNASRMLCTFRLITITLMMSSVGTLESIKYNR